LFLDGFAVRVEVGFKPVVGPCFFTLEVRLKSGLVLVNGFVFVVRVERRPVLLLGLLRLSEELVLLDLGIEVRLREDDRPDDRVEVEGRLTDPPEGLDEEEGRLTDPPEGLDEEDGRLTDPPEPLPPPEEERPTEAPDVFPRVWACASSSSRKKPRDRAKSKIHFLFMASPP
jgi:hypothetical protein